MIKYQLSEKFKLLRKLKSKHLSIILTMFNSKSCTISLTSMWKLRHYFILIQLHIHLHHQSLWPNLPPKPTTINQDKWPLSPVLSCSSQFHKSIPWTSPLNPEPSGKHPLQFHSNTIKSIAYSQPLQIGRASCRERVFALV